MLEKTRPSWRHMVVLFAGLVAAAAPCGVSAQSIKKKPSSVSGSPLDTLLSTRLWTTPPPMQDFVRETRPDPASLDYTPLTGQDPERPKPRDPANVKALQAELERDIQTNTQKAKALGGVVGDPASTPKPDPKTKPVTAKPKIKSTALKTSSAGAASTR